MTGTTVRIIHSGRLPDSMKASISFSRLTILLALGSELVASADRRASLRALLQIDLGQQLADRLGADAGGEASSPYSSWASRYASSVSSWCGLSGSGPAR